MFNGMIEAIVYSELSRTRALDSPSLSEQGRAAKALKALKRCFCFPQKHGIIPDSDIATNGETSDILDNEGHLDSSRTVPGTTQALKTGGEGMLGKCCVSLQPLLPVCPSFIHLCLDGAVVSGTINTPQHAPCRITPLCIFLLRVDYHSQCVLQSPPGADFTSPSR